MSVERVRTYLEKFGAEKRIIEFDVSSATVELAAAALGCPGERIAKSISFKNGDNAILVVAAGDAKIDNGKFKAQFNTKAKMLAPEEVEKLVGYSVGGVCPFGVNDTAKVYLDESLRRFETVFPACGSSNSAIELTVNELEEFSGSSSWVDVCKNWDNL